MNKEENWRKIPNINLGPPHTSMHIYRISCRATHIRKHTLSFHPHAHHTSSMHTKTHNTQTHHIHIYEETKVKGARRIGTCAYPITQRDRQLEVSLGYIGGPYLRKKERESESERER